MKKRRSKKKKLIRVIVKKNGTMINPTTRKPVTWKIISPAAKFIHEK